MGTRRMVDGGTAAVVAPWATVSHTAPEVLTTPRTARVVPRPLDG
jgi:hypothetical protein